MKKSHNAGMPKNSNFMDPDLEKELNNISFLTYLSNNPENQKSFVEYEKELNKEFEFDFTQFDKFFLNSENENLSDKREREKDKTGKNANRSKIKKISNEEINRMLAESDKRIFEEVQKELEETFDPFENVCEEDKIKAKNLINMDESILRLVDEGKISFEEIVFQIDYYELLSFIDKKKEFAVDSLKKISELFKEDESWKLAEEKLSRTINIANAILENKLDYKNLFEIALENFNDGNELKKVEEKDEIEENLKDSEKLSIRLCKSTQMQNKSQTNKNNLNSEKILLTQNHHTKIKENSKDNKKLLKSNASSNFPAVSTQTQSQKKKIVIDLLDVQNKMTNLLKYRSERKELIKLNKATDLNSRPDLFKFNFSKSKIQIDSSNKKEDAELGENQKFLELLEMPKIFLSERGEKKNFIRKRIEDAVNFYKNKLG